MEHFFKKLIEILSQLAGSIDRQVEATQTQTEWLKSHLDCATTEDLEKTEERIVKALGERIDPEIIRQLNIKLTGPTESLAAAVKANTPPT